MKKYFLLFAILTISISACKKEDVNAKDDASIQAYLKANNITATKDPSGLYYQIITPGGSTHPSPTSGVTVGYVGTKLDGSIFDQSLSSTFLLGNVIQGWQIGIPKIGIGGEIKLFIPSSLGYGNQDTGVIKANTVLLFDIKLYNYSY